MTTTLAQHVMDLGPDDAQARAWFRRNCDPESVTAWGVPVDWSRPTHPSRCYRVMACRICGDRHRPGEPHGNAMRPEYV